MFSFFGFLQQGVASAIMSLTNFTTGISLKLRNKAMSPVFSKKMGKQEPVLESEQMLTNQNDDNNSVHLRRLASDPQILSQDSLTVSKPIYVSEGENEGEDLLRVKSKIKSKYSRAVPLASGGMHNRTSGKQAKQESRKTADVDKSQVRSNNGANITVQIPLRAEVTVRDGGKKDQGHDAYTAAMLSEKTRLRLQQVSVEHQAASEKRQIERERIDKERERTIRDLRREEDDIAGDDCFSAVARDSDDSASTTSDSNSSSRKESLDSLSSPIATRKYQVVSRRVPGIDAKEAKAPVYMLTPAEIEQRELEKRQLDLFLGQFEVSDDESKSSQVIEDVPSPEVMAPRNLTTVENLGAKSLDEKLRILLDPNFQEKDGKLVRRNVSTSSSNSNTSPVDDMDLSRSYSYASQSTAKKANFAASIRGLDKPLKTKVIGLSAAKLNMPAYNPDMAARFDTFKQKKQELEKKVSTILQETSKTKSIYDNECNKTDEQKVASLRQKSQFSQPQRLTSPTQRVIVSATDIASFPQRAVSSHAPPGNYEKPSRHHIESSLQRLDRNVQQVVELLQDSHVHELQSENSDLAALLSNLQRQASSENDYLSTRSTKHQCKKSGADEKISSYQQVPKRSDVSTVKPINSGKGDLVRVQQWRTGSDQTKHDLNKFYPR